MQPRSVSFALNGTTVTLPGDVAPSETLLRWLRGPAGLTGTKEGCAEGDCGACTVVIEQPDGARTPINACLVALGQLDGLALRTVEGLRAHPIQHALADGNATQCGFCTPGFVMAAWAHAREGGDLHEALAGNLCRCTGYRPIVAALASLPADPPDPPRTVTPAPAIFESPQTRFYKPTALPDLLDLRAAHPDAWLLAGGTDLGLLLSEARDRPAAIISLAAIPDLARIEPTGSALHIGAAVTYERLLRALPDLPALAGLAPLLTRLGSRQIRGLGTLGGNLGTASPIGDMLPPLLALDATVHLASRRGERALPVADFLQGYRRNALAPDEVIRAIALDLLPPGAAFVCDKVSKRFDQDISTVCAAFLLHIEAGNVRTARLAFGGMGPSACRAPAAEAALQDQPWTSDTVEAATRALAHDLTPISDLRGTARYRQDVAAGLLRRLWWRIERPDLLSAYDLSA